MATLVKSNGKIVPEIPSLLNDFFSRDLLDWPFTGSRQSSGMPAVNIRETNDTFELEVAAPGLDKNDFNVELNNNMLVISAERSDQKEQKDNENIRREFNYSSFRRTFTLDERMVESDKINATYKNGILNITIPKSNEAKVKPATKIKIN